MIGYFRYGLLRIVIYFIVCNLLANNLLLLLYLAWGSESLWVLCTAIMLFFTFLGLLGALAVSIRTLIGFRNLATYLSPLFLLLLNLPLNALFVYLLHQAN